MHVWTEIRPQAQNFQGGTLTIGNFDGLHRGHQKLLEAINEGPSPHIVVTFDPHPVQVLYPERQLRSLFPREDLQEQLPGYGMDLLLKLRFDHALAQLLAEEFLRRKIYEPFQPARLVVGYDFALGANRTGDLNWLKRWSSGQKVELFVVPPFSLDGQIVSSRAVREWIASGDVRAAAKNLGRPFYVRGEVIHGAGRGRGLGFPTLNFPPATELRPMTGVYATRTRFNGRSYKSVTNVGQAPTFQTAGGLQIETHILDESLDLYGRTVDIEFIARLRPEVKFNGPEDLKKQIEKDILEARRILE
jgi:riboflavin kinase/FMN adenylyltransferase